MDDIKNVFGITPYNLYKTAFQKAIEIYPELLNDAYIRIKLKDIKDSLVKKYKSGKLQVKGNILLYCLTFMLLVNIGLWGLTNHKAY